jgi:hypothetical protein
MYQLLQRLRVYTAPMQGSPPLKRYRLRVAALQLAPSLFGVWGNADLVLSGRNREDVERLASCHPHIARHADDTLWRSRANYPITTAAVIDVWAECGRMRHFVDFRCCLAEFSAQVSC